MFNSAKSNPIFARFLRQSRWPSTWETVLLFVVIGIMQTGLIIAMIHREIYLQSMPNSAQIGIIFVIHVLAFLVLVPLAVEITSALLIATDVQSEAYTLLLISVL